VKTVSKRILIFTNEDDPFGTITGAVKTDMIRTTVQRAKAILLFKTACCQHISKCFFCTLFTITILSFLQDAQDLGLSSERLPLSWSDEQFDMSLFYAVCLHNCFFLFSMC
jgi:ATP-dependent DNA helicase 2 subunit 1